MRKGRLLLAVAVELINTNHDSLSMTANLRRPLRRRHHHQNYSSCLRRRRQQHDHHHRLRPRLPFLLDNCRTIFELLYLENEMYTCKIKNIKCAFLYHCFLNRSLFGQQQWFNSTALKHVINENSIFAKTCQEKGAGRCIVANF